MVGQPEPNSLLAELPRACTYIKYQVFQCRNHERVQRNFCFEFQRFSNNYRHWRSKKCNLKGLTFKSLFWKILINRFIQSLIVCLMMKNSIHFTLFISHAKWQLIDTFFNNFSFLFCKSIKQKKEKRQKWN